MAEISMTLKQQVEVEKKHPDVLGAWIQDVNGEPHVMVKFWGSHGATVVGDATQTERDMRALKRRIPSWKHALAQIRLLAQRF